MSFLLISNSDELLPLVLNRDGWHHSINKLRLITNVDGTLCRDRYKESIKGLLYISNNRLYVNNRNNLNCVIYPAYNKLVKLNYYFLKKMLALHKDKSKYTKYDWFINDGSCISSNFIDYSINALSSFINKCSPGKYNVNIDDNKYIGEKSSLANFDFYYNESMSIKRLFKENIIILFFGSKYFVLDNELNLLESKIPDDIIELAKEIKKEVGIAILSISFAKDNDNYYFYNVSMPESIPNVDSINSEYFKFVNTKMKYIENKVSKVKVTKKSIKIPKINLGEIQNFIAEEIIAVEEPDAPVEV